MNKTDNLTEKWARDFKGISLRMSKRPRNTQKSCLILLNIQETQGKTTTRYHLHLPEG